MEENNDPQHKRQKHMNRIWKKKSKHLTRDIQKELLLFDTSNFLDETPKIFCPACAVGLETLTHKIGCSQIVQNIYLIEVCGALGNLFKFFSYLLKKNLNLTKNHASASFDFTLTIHLWGYFTREDRIFDIDGQIARF